MKQMKRLATVILCFVLAFSMIPMNAFATETQETTQESTEDIVDNSTDENTDVSGGDNDTEPEEEPEVEPPAATATLEKSGSVFTVHDNGSGVTCVRYMYTAEAYTVTTWYNFCVTGKVNKNVNGNSGYRAVSGKVDEETGVSSLDGKMIDLTVAGYYTFWITDGSGAHYDYYYVSEEDLLYQKPYVTVQDNSFSLVDNDSGLVSALYMYTPEPYTYTTWYNFHTTGKQNVDVNGKSGYRSIKDISVPFECIAKGYYTVLMTYKNGLTRAQTVYVNQYKATVKFYIDDELCEIGSLYTDGEVVLKDGDSYLPMTYVGKGSYTASNLDQESYEVYIKEGDNYTAIPGSAVIVTPSQRDIKVSYYNTTATVKGASFEGEDLARVGETYTAKLTANAGMQLPSFINVKVNGATLAYGTYTYSFKTGEISIPGELVTGRVVFTVIAQEYVEPITITLNAMGGAIYDGSWTDEGNYVYTYETTGQTILPTPTAPCGSETVTFAGWYTDLAYSNKVTIADFDADTKLYAKWTYSATSYKSGGMYYAYGAAKADVRGVNSSGSYIRTTYNDGGYKAYYYYNNGSAYPYAMNSTSDYGGTAFSFVSSTGTSIFKQIGSTGIYYAQVMALEGGYATINYVLVNTNSSDIKNFTLGAGADVQIASNDRAAISVGTDANGTYLIMEDGSTYAFRMYTGIADYWIGGYSSSYCYNGKGYSNNILNCSASNSNHYDKKYSTGVDSALAFSWKNQTIPANGTIIKTAKLGVGTISEMGKNSLTSVTLSANGGAFSTGSIYTMSSSASTIKLSGAEVPVREGYTFIGWNTAANGRGDAYATSASVPSITLYAQWQKEAGQSYAVQNKSVVLGSNGKSLSSKVANIIVVYEGGVITQNSTEYDVVSTDADFVATLSVSGDGYCMPNSLTITVGGVQLVQGTDYIYSVYATDPTAANLRIYASALTGKVVIKAIGGGEPAEIPNVVIDSYKEVKLKESATAKVTASIDSDVNYTYSYRWYMATGNTNSGGKALAQYTDTLNVSSVTTSKVGSYYFYCTVTAKRGNGQKSTVVSDVFTLVVNKLSLSDITVSVDEDYNVSVSSNPGRGEVQYEYFTDAACTERTTTENGAAFAGGKPSLDGTYYVRATIAESANYYDFTTPATEFTMSGLPYVTQDGKYATLVNNTSGLSKVYYMYSTDVYTYTTWYNFTMTGKNNKSVNGANGYKAVSGTVEGQESSLDGSTITLSTAGYYTFLMYYGDGKMVTRTLLVTESDLLKDVPYITQRYVNDNYAILNNNGSGLYKVQYMYSVESYNYSTWYNFYMTGKLNKQENTTSGYRMITGEAGEGEGYSMTSTLDGTSILMSKAGYYTFIMTYGDGKITTTTVRVGENIAEVTSSGMKITYTDELTSGSISQYSYMFYGDSEPDITGTFTFKSNATDKTTIERSEEEQTTFSFVAPNTGWYIVRVVDDVMGTKYYKVYASETQQSGTEKVVLVVNGTNISATMLDDSSVLYVKFADDEDYQSGNKLKVDSTGIYTIEVIDSNGYSYTLVANILTLNPNETINYSQLNAQITTAEKALTLYQIVDDPDAQTVPGSYVSTENAEVMTAALATAKNQRDDAVTQDEVNAAYKALKTATAAFKSTVRVIEPQLVYVEGSTITIQPADENYALANVRYNISEEKELVPYAIQSWTGLSARKYATVTTFTEGRLVFENVPNGIYSFYINQDENGSTKNYIRYAIVENGETEQAVAISELDRYLEMANSFKESYKRESEASVGDLYVSDAKYENLLERIESAQAMAEALDADASCKDIYEDIIPELVYLLDAMKQVEKGAGTMEEATEIIPVEITVNADQTVTFTSESVLRAYVAYGDCKNWYQLNKAGYELLTFENGTAQYTDTKFNGTYTALITYNDGSQVYEKFEIDGAVYPFTVTETDGMINIDFNDSGDITEVGYGYGEITNRESEDFYVQAVEDNATGHSFHAMGNGLHSVFVEYANGDVYYVTVDVTSCSKPAVFELNGNLGVFTHGFTINYVSYAAGTYNNWNDMYANAKYLDQNAWFQMNEESGFTSGSNYTFYFSGENCDYLVNVEF